MVWSARISPNANAYGSETVPMPLLYWHGFDTIRNTKNAIKEVLREFYRDGVPEK